MKTTIFYSTLIFLLFLTTNVKSQDQLSQKEIIGIENTVLLQDFNLREKNGVFPVKIDRKKYSKVLGGFLRTELQFNTNKLLEVKIEEVTNKYERFVYSYSSTQLTKLQVYNKSGALRAFYPETFYTYNTQGNLVSTKSTPRFLSDPKINTYTYDLENDKVTMSSTAGNKSEFILDKSFRITSKFNYDKEGLSYKYFYEYDDANRVVKVKKENLSRNAFQLLSEESYQYNNRGYISKHKLSNKATLAYDYIYDDYGNWIVKYSITDSNPIENIVTRYITYSNGKTTGYKTNEDANLKTKLKKNTEIPGGFAVMLKNGGKSYSVYKDGSNISANSKAYKQHTFGSDMVFQDIADKKHYVLKDYTKKENYVYLPLTGKNSNYGIWVMTGKLAFNIFDEKGNSLLSKIKSQGFDTSNSHYLVTLQSGREIILRNVRTAELYKPKVVELYVENTKTNSITNPSTVSVASNAIAEKVKRYFEETNGDKSAIAKAINADYSRLMKNLSGDALYKEGAKYFVALNDIHPSLPFSIFMKWEDLNSIKPIRERLPKEVQDNVKKAAQGLVSDYNKYINSKEVKDKVKKAGGGYYKN